jgi:hypothetical protein
MNTLKLNVSGMEQELRMDDLASQSVELSEDEIREVSGSLMSWRPSWRCGAGGGTDEWTQGGGAYS